MTKTHMKVYELGELVKDVPLAMSSAKRSMKYVSRQLSGLAEGELNEDVFKALRPPDPDDCTLCTEYDVESRTCSEASVSFRDTSSTEEDTIKSMGEPVEVVHADHLDSATEVALADLKEDGGAKDSDSFDTSFDTDDGEPSAPDALKNINEEDKKTNTVDVGEEEVCESLGAARRKRSFFGWPRLTRDRALKVGKKSSEGGETRQLLEQDCMPSDTATLTSEMRILQKFEEASTIGSDMHDTSTLGDVSENVQSAMRGHCFLAC